MPDKIISRWKKLNCNSSNLEEKFRIDKAILMLPLISVLDDVVKAELINVFGDQVLL